jgi:hypothetical protein
MKAGIKERFQHIEIRSSSRQYRGSGIELAQGGLVAQHDVAGTRQAESAPAKTAVPMAAMGALAVT